MAKAPPATISWFPWWLRGFFGRWLLRSAVLTLVVGAFVGGVIWLGWWSLTQIHEDERYRIPLIDVECNVPEGMQRHDFIDEVQYHSRLPDRVNVLDDDLGDRLGAAFARHPWVERVERVTVTPPRHIVVQLRFRAPVLAVPWDGELRAVDAAGVLLPKQAPTRGLPIYDGIPRPPRGPAGTPWGDPDLARAAQQAREPPR